MPALALQGLTKKFGNTLAIDNLNLRLEANSCGVLFGCSGAGKTTLLRLIAGLELPDSGQVRLDNQPVTELAPNRRSVSLVSQDAALYPQLSLRKNLALALKRLKLPRSEAEQRIQQVLIDLRIQHLQHRLPAEISGGEAGRVAFARGLVPRPRLLLLDEPLSQLDGINKQTAIELLEEVREKFNPTLLVVSHDPIDALRLADHLVILDRGQSIDEGPPMRVYDNPRSRLSGQLLSPFGMNWLDQRRLPERCQLQTRVANEKRFLGFRPESVQVAGDRNASDGLTATVVVDAVHHLGFSKLVQGRICETDPSKDIPLQWLSEHRDSLAQRVTIFVPGEDIRFVDD